ncbi:YheC/YheD family endospore coat-associated protein [Bacillus sp. FJAT-27245]|uniref:YheC/YheD family endospore coat-associated protein n=1 Tax=Bacillus sp. FJAT-27245 TaxID=1684144 RepID=UPI0006A782A2|nr:YheC/YheD family protein [Bacillus sp. FJAT-27245]
MVTIGMLHYRKDPEKVNKVYAYAAAAKMEGVNFFYFTPGKVNLDKKQIVGLFYEKGRWVEREVGYPDVIFNAGGTLTSKQDEIVDALEKEIPFTSHAIGDKMSVYYRIKKSGKFSQYLIPSEKVERIQTIFLYLNNYNSIIIKPVSGAKGEGIIFVEKRGENYSLKADDIEHNFSKEELDDWIAELLIRDEEYLVQPFIRSETKRGLAFDFRLHVQKNGQGKWVNTAIYPRIADTGVVSNISYGGYTSILDGFLRKQFDEEFYNVKRYLENFAIQFSTHFDSLYDEPLDELGIDIGMDENQKIWLYEVNWRPGAPVLFYLEMDIAKRAIEYAVYLAKQNGAGENK